MKTRSVEFVPALDLCTSCGVCAGVCPTAAVSLDTSAKGIWVPVIDSELCTNCELCVKSCAGHSFDFGDHSLSLFGSLPEHPEIGHFQAIYSGYSLDEDVRWKCQSGGMVSTLLIYLLRQGAIDGAVVTRWDPCNPLSAEPSIARTPQEVLQAAGSKYCPVPVGRVVSTILEQEGAFAFVGTPCQLQSLRKAEEAIPKLRKKVYIHIGLFCLNVFTLHFHEHMLRKLGLECEDVKSFAYRSKEWRGWPCDMRIETHSRQVFNLEGRYSRLAPRPFFSAWRCQLCIDKLNEFADISLGDCRIARHYGSETLEQASYGNNPGRSDIIARTVLGHDVVEAARRDGMIALDPTDWDEIADTTMSSEKKLGYATFSTIASRVGRGVPRYGVAYSPVREDDRAVMGKLGQLTLIGSLFYLLSDMLREYRAYRWLLRMAPHRFMEYLNRIRHRCLAHERLQNCRLAVTYGGDAPPGRRTDQPTRQEQAAT